MGGELADSPAQVVQGSVEAAGVAGRYRVGDGPVQCRELAELFAGAVAYRDDEVAVPKRAAEVLRAPLGQRQLVATGGVDRARVDRVARVGACRCRGHGAGLPPQCGG